MTFLAGVALGAAAAAIVSGLLFRGRRRRLGRFLAFAIHEVNTPVTAVNMTVLNFSSGVFGPIPAEQQPWFDILREQVVRLNALVGELRDLVHLEIGRDLRIETGPVDAAAALRRAVESVARSFAQAKAQVLLEIAPDLPKVRADEDRLERALVSLLHHARKFKAKGDVGVQASRSEAGGVAIAISYPSLPLAEAEAARSLALFYPADAAQGAAVASGLGLGLLRELAERQGGRLSLSVREGPRARLLLELDAKC